MNDLFTKLLMIDNPLENQDKIEELIMNIVVEDNEDESSDETCFHPKLNN